MWLVVFIVFFSFLLYVSWHYPSFAIVYFLLFNYVTYLIADHLGISLPQLVIRYAFFFLIILRSFSSKENVVNINSVIFNCVAIGIVILVFSLMYYYFLLDDSLSNQRFEFIKEFFLSSLFPCIFLIYTIKSPNDIVLFLKGIIVFGIVFYIIIFISGAFSMVDYSDRSSFEETAKINSIALSRISGVIMLTAVSTSEYFTKKRIKLALICVSLFFVVASAQRGTIIGVLLALSYFFYTNGTTINIKKIVLYSIIALNAIYFLYSFGFFDVLIYRFNDLENVADYERTSDYIKVYSIFKINDFLYGLGPMGYFFRTGREYPHSFFLELVVEYGILGFVSFILILYGVVQIIYSKHKKFKKHSAYQYIVMCWLVLFTSSLVSSNIIYNDSMFIFTIMILLANSLLKQQNV